MLREVSDERNEISVGKRAVLDSSTPKSSSDGSQDDKAEGIVGSRTKGRRRMVGKRANSEDKSPEKISTVVSGELQGGLEGESQ